MSSRGLILWAVDSLGNPVKVLADADGTLRVDGIISVSGTVDVSDRPGRLVGIVYGSLGQLLQRASTLDLLVQLRNAGADIDPRQIRLLTSADVISAVQSGAWSVGVSNFPTDYFKAGQNIGNTGFDVNNFPSTYDVGDRAGRLLGIVYGSQSQQLLQRASTYDLIVQLRSAGVEIDPRSIRALAKATDEVYSVLRTDAGVAYDARDRSWTITENLNRAWSLAKATDNVYAVLKTDAGVALDPRDRNWSLTNSDAITAYGSQAQKLLQRAVTYESIIQLSHQGTEYDARQIRALTSADVVDIVDKAARLLGVVYGSQGQQIKQTATNFNLQVELATGATLYDARQIRALTSSDVVTVYGSRTQALLQRAATYDLLVALRQGGSELSTSNPIFAGVVDASGNRLPSMDAAARRGYVTITDGTNVMPTMDASARAGYVDVIDRAARLLGVVYGSQGQQLLQRASTYDLLVQLRSAGAEISATNALSVGIASGGSIIDPRTIRALSYATDSIAPIGSQAQTLLQRATTYDLIVQLRSAGAEIDPRSIRALTSSDVVTVADVTKTGTSHYLAPTALGVGGTATIWTPAGGKAIRAKRIQVSVDAATRIDFRWTTTAFESYYLPANGSIVVNLVGSNEQPAADATLTILSSAAANVTAKASGDEV